MIHVAGVAANFGPDLDFDLQRIATLIEHAREAGIQLLVLPDAAFGGYLSDMGDRSGAQAPAALQPDSPYVKRTAALARDMTVCVGYCEAGVGMPYNSAICLTGDGMLGHHRKVHRPPAEREIYAPGEQFEPFDTPVGRIGMLIDYDKTFPESARSLALEGARIIACLSAWPTSITNRAPRMRQDRQARLFDLYDCARAAENQAVVVTSNLTGTQGAMRFLGQAKVVGPGGEILARTWSKAGIATAAVDVDVEISTARRTLHHLRDRRPQTYRGDQ